MQPGGTELEAKSAVVGWLGVLDWMARIRVASVEAAAVALGVSARQIQMHGRRLEAERLVARRRMSDGGGGVMVITPRGTREAGYEVRSGTTPVSRTALLHGRGVSWIAAYNDLRGHPWVGPLELRDCGYELQLRRQGVEPPGTHLPDLGFEFEGERWAVEFERTPKSRARLRRILGGYLTAQIVSELDTVLYVCATPAIVRLVAEVAEEVDRTAFTGRELKLVIRSLDRVIRDAREGRGT